MQQVKKERARILGQIQKSYINSDVLVDQLMIVEDFEKSLTEDDIFYTQDQLNKYMGAIQEKIDKAENQTDKDSILEKSKQEMELLQKKVLVNDEGYRHVVYLKKK